MSQLASTEFSSLDTTYRRPINPEATQENLIQAFYECWQVSEEPLSPDNIAMMVGLCSRAMDYLIKLE